MGSISGSVALPLNTTVSYSEIGNRKNKFFQLSFNCGFNIINIISRKRYIHRLTNNQEPNIKNFRIFFLLYLP